MKIRAITARQILDSRGNPTVEADVKLENGLVGRAAVPSGASTGTREAVELRDGGRPFGGLGVLESVAGIKDEIARTLIGADAGDQEGLDRTLINLDGTPDKSRLGANAVLAVSLAAAKAAAAEHNEALWEHFQHLAPGINDPHLPLPMMNIISGGKHAAGPTDIQEFMIVPLGARSFHEALRWGTEVFHELGKVLAAGYATTVGDEGGYAPPVKRGNREALDMIERAVKAAGYSFGRDIAVALDVAASELYHDGLYRLTTEKRDLTSAQMIDYYKELAAAYPLVSLEDGLSQDDWAGWAQLTTELDGKLQLVGDDLFVTNPKFLSRGIKERAANAILIKLNQIGTVSETIATVGLAQSAGWAAVISHRSGETEDTTIADLAVGLATGQIKTGGLSRTDRVAKYNQLLRLEESLGDSAVFAGRRALVQTARA